MRARWRHLRPAICLWLATLTPVHANAASTWTPGPDASGDETYIGLIDTPRSGTTLTPNSQVTISGWAVDQTAVGWSGIEDVQVHLGLRDQGRTLLVHANVGIPRNDGMMAGWQLTLHPRDLTVEQHELYIYAESAYWPNETW